MIPRSIVTLATARAHSPLLAALVLVGFAGAGMAEERTVLILHTNDFHDHARPGYEGQGGLPYVAGYLRGVRAKRGDTLLLDAGDVREKGDWVGYLTEGQLMFEAMGRIGYDAVVPGNHDVKVSMEHLDQCQEWLGVPFICANILNPDGTPRYLPSRIFEVNGVRLGVIGLTRRGNSGVIPGSDFSRRVLAEEAARIRDEVHVVIALVHEGGAEAIRLAQAAPEVDVVVAGHTHHTHREPVVIEETGAIMVQAGANALFVGRLELTVDTATGQITQYHGELIPMDHNTVSPDPEVLAMVMDAEAEHCPDAGDLVAHADRAVGMAEVAQLTAEALRIALDADIGLAMADRVVRNNLPAGPIDVNAVFRALAPWAFDTLVVEITGEELLGHLLDNIGTFERPAWSGAAVAFERGPDRRHRVAVTDIEPDRVYRVAVTDIEWDRVLGRRFDAPAAVPSTTGEVATNDALRQYLAGLGEADPPVCLLAEVLLDAATASPATAEAR